MRQTHSSTSVRLSQNKWKENFKVGFIEISGLISCVFESKWEEAEVQRSLGGEGLQKFTGKTETKISGKQRLIF